VLEAEEGRESRQACKVALDESNSRKSEWLIHGSDERRQEFPMPQLAAGNRAIFRVIRNLMDVMAPREGFEPPTN
jgi:hypothetical protein